VGHDFIIGPGVFSDFFLHSFFNEQSGPLSVGNGVFLVQTVKVGKIGIGDVGRNLRIPILYKDLD